MNILVGTVFLGVVCALLWRKLPDETARRRTLVEAARLAGFVFPRIVVALIGAALFAELLPAETIRTMFGSDAGLFALVLAVLIGPITPGGPFVCFAVAAAGLQAGASAPVVMGYVTSWAAFSLTKTFAYEVPLLGGRFVLWRVLLSLPLPFAVAALAGLAG